MSRWVGQSLNGQSDATRWVVSRTEQLTQSTGLAASTTLGFASFTTFNGLLRRDLAWSPQFLEESECQYLPLVWSLEAVRVCPASGKALVSRCPRCREQMNTLSSGSIVGHCYRCGASLAEQRASSIRSDPVSRGIRNMDYEMWIAQEVASFVSSTTKDAFSQAIDFGAALRFWLRQFDLGDTAKAAKCLCEPQMSLIQWLRGTKPRLRTTLSICWVMDLSLLEFIQCRVPSSHAGRLRSPVDLEGPKISSAARRPVDQNQLKRRLTTIVRENLYPMMSFSEICSRHLNRRDTVVREVFPDAARTISARFLANRQLLARVQREQFIGEIRAIAEFLHSQGIVPNYKTMRPYLQRPGRLRCAWAIEALEIVRTELGYSESEQLLLGI